MKIYCRYCDKVTKHHEKGVRTPVNVCSKCNTTNMPITLIKSNGEMHFATQVKFVEWSAEELGSRAKQLHAEPALGFSCILDPQYSYQYTWLTTQITEIVSDDPGKDIRKIVFRTKNSEYSLYISNAELRSAEPIINL